MQTYFSTSLFLLRIFMVLLSRPRNVKPYLQEKTSYHKEVLDVITSCKTICLDVVYTMWDCQKTAEDINIQRTCLSSQLTDRAFPYFMAPMTRAISSGEEAMKPLCSCGEWSTSPSTPKPSTWSVSPSICSWPSSVDSFTWTVWQRHRARRNSSSLS